MWPTSSKQYRSSEHQSLDGPGQMGPQETSRANQDVAEPRVACWLQSTRRLAARFAVWLGAMAGSGVALVVPVFAGQVCRGL